MSITIEFYRDDTRRRNGTVYACTAHPNGNIHWFAICTENTILRMASPVRHDVEIQPTACVQPKKVIHVPLSDQSKQALLGDLQRSIHDKRNKHLARFRADFPYDNRKAVERALRMAGKL